MKIVLISLDQELFTVGIRTLSSYLRQEGYPTTCVFLPADDSKLKSRINWKQKFQREYSRSMLDDLFGFCEGADLIGISLLTNQFLQAVQITTFLKKSGLTTPVIWGGIEPTVEPEACLQYADMVCVGEGEEALLELVKKMEAKAPIHDISNIWVKVGNQLVKNPARMLEQKLDRYPLPDYTCVDHYFTHNNRIVALTKEEFSHYRGERFRVMNQKLDYPIMTSRGCPYACTYCCNSTYEELYTHQKRLRWRGTDQIISELKMIANELAQLHTVFFVDDNFTARSLKDLQEFCNVYKKEIGVPFYCQVSPLTIDDERMKVLLDAGCIKIAMGVETANERIAGIYNRKKIHAVTPDAVRLVESYRHKMPLPPTYQFIIDNPYETLDETLATLNFALALQKPWDNPIYSLTLYPGTLMYKMAVKDGLVKNKNANIYGKNWLVQSRSFIQLWIRLYRANFPRPILKFMLTPWLVKRLSSRSAQRAA